MAGRSVWRCPDCEAASEVLCRTKGFTTGSSLHIQSEQKCPVWGWINGENFLTMKREGLLFGPFAESLPNFALVDVVGKPTTRIDFSEPVEFVGIPVPEQEIKEFLIEKATDIF